MKTWLEVALNGSWGRALQPGIPVSVAEIIAEGIACAREGAAIVHVHAYDEASGRQCAEAHVYRRIIEGIRSQVDCIVYPTIPLASDMPAAERFAAVEALARSGLIEWSVLDPGSVHIAGFVYINPEGQVRHGLALAARYGFHPAYAIYEPGFVRLGAALARAAQGAPQPVYRFMFSEGFAFGFPPAEYALDAYLRLLASEAPGAPWMVGGLAVDVLKLAPVVIARGGHVRVGLEDAPLGLRRSNLDWVQAARGVIERTGATLACAADGWCALWRSWPTPSIRRMCASSTCTAAHGSSRRASGFAAPAWTISKTRSPTCTTSVCAILIWSGSSTRPSPCARISTHEPLAGKTSPPAARQPAARAPGKVLRRAAGRPRRAARRGRVAGGRPSPPAADRPRHRGRRPVLRFADAGRGASARLRARDRAARIAPRGVADAALRRWRLRARRSRRTPHRLRIARRNLRRKRSACAPAAFCLRHEPVARDGEILRRSRHDRIRPSARK